MRYLIFTSLWLIGLTAHSQTEDVPIVSDTISFRTVCNSTLKPADAPLYILNGKPISKGHLKRINHKDIKSLQLLKKEAATALYGVRGSKGALIILTKD